MKQKYITLHSALNQYGPAALPQRARDSLAWAARQLAVTTSELWELSQRGLFVPLAGINRAVLGYTAEQIDAAQRENTVLRLARSRPFSAVALRKKYWPNREQDADVIAQSIVNDTSGWSPERLAIALTTLAGATLISKRRDLDLQVARIACADALVPGADYSGPVDTAPVFQATPRLSPPSEDAPAPSRASRIQSAPRKSTFTGYGPRRVTSRRAEPGQAEPG